LGSFPIPKGHSQVEAEVKKLRADMYQYQDGASERFVALEARIQAPQVDIAVHRTLIGELEARIASLERRLEAANERFEKGYVPARI
jgi:hypothetical protein